MKNVLKNRTFLKLLSASIAVLTIGISSLSIMLSSHNEWQDYYDNVMEEKEYQEYLQTLPLTFEGLSVELSDAVTYFDDGFANPTKNDFLVTAHFSEKGKQFDKLLKAEDYELVIPEDFATNGGKVIASYTFIPEGKNEDDTPKEPVVKTAELNLTLTKVVVTGLRIIELPYRVYYSDNMAFDPEGMVLEAKYNNGKTQVLDAKKITVEKTGNLVAGTESVEVSYSTNDVKVTTNVPIKVDTISNYRDGAITSIEAEGKNYAIEGELLSNCKPLIRAYYANGNRLYLDSSKCDITANVEKASFLKNCILTITLKDNPLISCRTIVSVRYQIEAEDTTLVGGSEKEIQEYIYNDDNVLESAGNSTIMDGFTKDNKISFKINSTGVAKGKLYVRAANVSNDVALNNAINLKVNDRVTPIYASALVTKEQKHVFNNYLLNIPVLNNGENTIELTFKNANGSNVGFDKFIFETSYDGEFFDSIDSFITENVKKGDTPNLSVEKVSEWEKVSYGTYMHGLCTDGEYIYAARTTYSEGARAILVTKTDPNTGRIVTTSPRSEAKSSETSAGLTIVEDKVVIFFNDGTEWAINKDLSGSWTEYKDFNFEKLENSALRDVCYNTKTQNYAVLVDTTVYIFDKEQKFVSSFSANAEGSLGLKRITATEDHIYALFSKDGSYQPVIHTYTWDGTHVGRFVVNNNTDVMGSVVTSTTKTNCQGLVFYNDSLYVSILKFGTSNGGDAAALIKASYDQVSEDLTINLTLGEHIASSKDKGEEPVVTASPSLGTTGKINSDVSGYAMGGVSDGKYLYYSINTGGNQKTTIVKVDPISYKEVAKSSVIDVATQDGDNSRLFIKDGNIYCIGQDNKIFACALDSFVNACKFEEVNLSITDLDIAKSICWNEEIGRYAYLSQSTLTIADNLGNALNRVSIAKSGWATSSVAADDKYIFVSYTLNNKVQIPVDVYTWDGVLVASLSVGDFGLGSNIDFNVQSLYIHNGILHASVCSWTNGANKFYDWTINIGNNL